MSISTLFVNYADFYVNIIMSTPATAEYEIFMIFDYFATFRADWQISAQNVVCAVRRPIIYEQVNIIYPLSIFCAF